ncbi:MAG: ABC-F family ATP-binding cassette domain-containing protein, partial [Oscillospiraceae bacterium]|nr:ABC-F family ATP-binding cassette domain-containing protein [Oscillospiraceae bacterium]
NDNDRIALIGPNGAGKTTLLNIIAGGEYDEGDISCAPDLKIGYLHQNGGLAANGTIESEMRRATGEVWAVEQAMLDTADIMSKLDHTTDEYKRLEEEYHSLEMKFTSLDGYQAQVRINTVLNGMGFGSFDKKTPVDTMSGGERTRLMLAKLLVEEPKLLILDEATNHLDFKMLAWLEEYLQGYRGAILTVSHDRYFLDRVTNITWEIENLSLVSYPAPYSRYLDLKQQRYERMEKEYERYVNEVARLQEYADKNMARASTSQSAKSRLRMIEHLDEAQKPYLPPKPPRMKFTSKLRPVSDVLVASGLEITVGSGAEKRVLLRNGDIHVKRGERVAIIGENGAGKSTLLKTLEGKLPLHKGSVEFGKNVQLSSFSQDSSDLHSEKTALMELWDRFPAAVEQELRTLLGGLQLVGEEAFKTIGVLSGGERARIKLGIVMLEHGNLLLMDEPTNHLDIPAKEALEEALAAFEGTLVIVSHDRYLLSRLPTRIIRMADGEIESFSGGFEEMQQKLIEREEQKRQAANPVVKVQSEEKKQYHRSKAQRSAEVAAQKRLAQLEKDIEDTEALITKTQETMADPDVCGDYEKLSELSAEITRLEQLLQEYYEQLDEML